MISSLREKLTGIIAIAIIILLAIPLAFVGVESIFLNSSRVSNVGSVNGKDISEIDYSRALAARENQLIQLLGENYSPDNLEPGQIESAALSGLVDLYLYYTHAEDNGMGVTDEYVVRQIQQMPQFQVNGAFSDILFSNYINQLGFTANTFISAFGEELLSSMYRNALQTSAFSTQQLLELNIGIAQEKRSYQTLLLPVDVVLDEVEVSDSEIADYYANNSSQFMLPERVSLDYVELSSANFEEDVEVTEEEVAQRFNLVMATLPTRRQAAHILVEPTDDNSHVATLDQLQLALEEGGDFGELAEQYSDDIGSSGNGGLLGYTDGSSFPEEFEAALAELEVDEVSAPVLTDAGFHVIKLIALDRQEFNLEDEYAGLEQQIRVEKATDLYRQNLNNLRDASFSTDDLPQLIAQFSDVKSLEVEQTDLFSRQAGTGIAEEDIVRAIAFSEIVLDQKLNSEIIELGDDNARAVVVHLNQRLAPGVADLAEVSEQIELGIRRTKGTAALEQRAISIQARLEDGDEVEDVARDEDIEWQVQLDQTRGTGGLVGNSIFSVPLTKELPIVGSQVQVNGDYLIYSIDEVSAGSLDDFSEVQVSQLASQMSQLVASAENQAYIDTLRSNADIDFKIDVDIE